MNEDIVLPKLKKESKKVINILDEDLALIYDMTPKQRVNYFVCLGIFVFIIGVVSVLFVGQSDLFNFENEVNIEYVNVISYDLNDMIAKVYIQPDSNQVGCTYYNEGEEINGTLKDNKCYLSVEIGEGKVSFVNKNSKESEFVELDNYVLDLKVKDKYYLPLNYEMVLGEEKIVVGKPVVNWISLSESVQIIDGKLKTKKVGSTIVRGIVNDIVVKEIEIIVTDTIVAMPNTFDDKKEYLPCNEYTLEESRLLDEILEYRINEAGYQTRAGAVAAARFLTLEFPYRIAYYWETGRLNNTGKKYVDGEGRYYHKGLYLHESKKESIVASALGPQIWGCNMKCYEDDPPYFYPGRKYPNGLDCSGFVSWVLYNAGFDVGDRGAGESPTPYQLTDVGDFRTLTSSLIKSGKIKPGDLFNYWGHISILVGEDDSNYYIAESLNTLGGVVIKTYSKKKVMNTFKYVVLMDELYKEDGNLTDLWY